MVMKAMRKGAQGGIGKIILFGFMGMAVGGLVLMDVGGFFRTGGTGSNNVLKVGSEKISIQSFDRDLRRQLARVGISPQDAYRMGYTNQMLGAKLRETLFEQSAEDNGIMISKQRVANHVKTLITPLVQEGQSAQDVLRQILSSQGMTEQNFSRAIANEMSNSLLSNAFAAGFERVSDGLVDDMYRHAHERRDVFYVPILASSITDVKKPEDSQLEALYQSTKEQYAIPAVRHVKMLTLKDDALKASTEISEEKLRAAYGENAEAYFTPEKVTMEQALFETQEDAQEALDTFEKAKTSLKDVVKVSTYLGERAYTQQDLQQELVEAVSANKTEGAVIAPTQTPLGWMIARITQVEAEHTKPFDAVKDSLKAELLELAVLDQKYELAATIDDLLAGGASLEEVAEEVPVEITALPAFNNFGLDANNKDVLQDLGAQRQEVLDAARDLLEGETSPVMEMEDGSFRALYLEMLTPKAYKPFEDVRAQIEKRWISDQQKAESYGRAKELAQNDDVKATAQKMGYALKSLTAMHRDDEPKAPLTSVALNSVFEAAQGEPVVVDIDGGAAVVVVTNTVSPEITQDVRGADAYKELKAALKEEAQREGVNLYLETRRQDLTVKVNEALLERVYGAGSIE